MSRFFRSGSNPRIWLLNCGNKRKSDLEQASGAFIKKLDRGSSLRC